MKQVKKRLEQSGASVYLSGGTLLGAVRSNDFIPWDWDVEFMVHRKNFRRKQFMKTILKDGYNIKQSFLSGPPKISVQSVVEIEIFEFREEEKYYSCSYKLRNRHDMRILRKFFRKPSKINFKGINFAVPSPVEDFLTWRYGDWQNPKETSRSKKTYLTENFSPNRHKKKKKGLIYYTMKLPRKLAKSCDMLIVKILGCCSKRKTLL